jgi:hypothetical protein
MVIAAFDAAFRAVDDNLRHDRSGLNPTDLIGYEAPDETSMR